MSVSIRENSECEKKLTVEETPASIATVQSYLQCCDRDTLSQEPQFVCPPNVPIISVFLTGSGHPSMRSPVEISSKGLGART